MAFFVAVAGDAFNESKVAGRPAAVLGRASAFTAQEAGVGIAGLRRLDGFDDNPMLPIIAKIIHVAELCYPGCQQRGKFGRGCIVDPPVPIGVVRNENAVAVLVGRKLPEMVVEPAHRGLDDLVQNLEVR